MVKFRLLISPKKFWCLCILCIVFYLDVSFILIFQDYFSESFQFTSKIDRRHFFLCPFFQGGIGNMMFQFAGVYGMAKQRSMEIGIYETSEIYKVFSLSVAPIQNLSICARAFNYGEKRACAFDNWTTKFPANKDVLHRSFLQSWKYFSNWEFNIRKELKFKPYIEAKADSMIRRGISLVDYRHSDVVGVHVRRGDYLLPRNQKLGYRVASAKYLNEALSIYRKKLRKPVFLVFTNKGNADMAWCKNHITGSDVVYMFGTPRSREVDLCALSKCNHSIITSGSFGWWGAWLANGTVVYFKDFIAPGSPLRNEFSFDFKDYIYPGWIGL